MFIVRYNRRERQLQQDWQPTPYANGERCEDSLQSHKSMGLKSAIIDRAEDGVHATRSNFQGKALYLPTSSLLSALNAIRKIDKS